MYIHIHVYILYIYAYIHAYTLLKCQFPIIYAKAQDIADKYAKTMRLLERKAGLQVRERVGDIRERIQIQVKERFDQQNI